MAITLTVIPDDTLVVNGQVSHFMLTVANTDGAERAIKSVQFTPPPGAMGGFGASINIDLPDSTTISNGGAGSVPFWGTFYAQGSNLVDNQTSVTVPFVVRVAMTTADGVPTSNEVSDTISMSVVPADGSRSNFTYGDGLIDLESNNSTALALQLHLI